MHILGQQSETVSQTDESLSSWRLQGAVEHLAAVLKGSAGVSDVGAKTAWQGGYVLQALKHLMAALQYEPD